MSDPRFPTAEYLGDAVYAKIDDQRGLVLTTGHHDHDDISCTNVIFLEPQVVAQLKKYIERHKL